MHVICFQDQLRLLNKDSSKDYQVNDIQMLLIALKTFMDQIADSSCPGGNG
jgi:hypothetical protein